jgi:hypothetical protein
MALAARGEIGLLSVEIGYKNTSYVLGRAHHCDLDHFADHDLWPGLRRCFHQEGRQDRKRAVGIGAWSNQAKKQEGRETQIMQLEDGV